MLCEQQAQRGSRRDDREVMVSTWNALVGGGPPARPSRVMVSTWNALVGGPPPRPSRGHGVDVERARWRRTAGATFGWCRLVRGTRRRSPPASRPRTFRIRGAARCIVKKRSCSRFDLPSGRDARFAKRALCGLRMEARRQRMHLTTIGAGMRCRRPVHQLQTLDEPPKSRAIEMASVPAATDDASADPFCGTVLRM